MPTARLHDNHAHAVTASSILEAVTRKSSQGATADGALVEGMRSNRVDDRPLSIIPCTRAPSWLRTTLSAMSQDDLKPLLPTRTSSQTGVAAIDLKRLAVLCGCTVDDLHVQTPLQADGILAQPSTEVAFELPSSISAVQTGIDTALISLATRPGVFDTVSSPKALLLLAGEPVLVHVLRQLWLGGIRRVLIVLGAHGAATRSVLSGHPLAF